MDCDGSADDTDSKTWADWLILSARIGGGATGAAIFLLGVYSGLTDTVFFDLSPMYWIIAGLAFMAASLFGLDFLWTG
jgi:hypothetical protein